jgi:hypothetical protein
MPYPPTLVAGPCRNGRGLSDKIFQRQEAKKEEIEKAKGTVKVATNKKGVAGISIYDSPSITLLLWMISCELLKLKSTMTRTRGNSKLRLD